MPLAPRPSFVYFDLDDTLLDHRGAERAALADCHRAFTAHLGVHDLALVQAAYHAANVPLWTAYADGRIGRDDVQRLRFVHLLDTLGVAGLDPDEVGRYYLAAYRDHWAWVAGAEAAFRAVADRWPVGLLTNGFAEIQRAKLARFPVLAERAAAVVISEEAGAMKPHPAIFRHATAQAGVAPEAILYVGDARRSDVEGALGAGWQAAWWRGDASDAHGALAFATWDGLLDRLGVPALPSSS